MVAEICYMEFSSQFRLWKRERSRSYVTDEKGENGRKGRVNNKSNYFKTASKSAKKTVSLFSDERDFYMNRISFLVVCAALCMAGCASRPSLEKMALQRLPKALELAMQEEMSLPGGADIVSPRTIYACDSLCLIQCEAVARDSSGREFRFPVRYIFLEDVFMSSVKGHPVYAEMVTGCPRMSEEEMEMLRRKCVEDGDRMYVYYAGIADPIDKQGVFYE